MSYQAIKLSSQQPSYQQPAISSQQSAIKLRAISYQAIKLSSYQSDPSNPDITIASSSTVRTLQLMQTRTAEEPVRCCPAAGRAGFRTPATEAEAETEGMPMTRAKPGGGKAEPASLVSMRVIPRGWFRP
jgi:hypothetical protein